METKWGAKWAQTEHEAESPEVSSWWRSHASCGLGSVVYVILSQQTHAAPIRSVLTHQPTGTVLTIPCFLHSLIYPQQYFIWRNLRLQFFDVLTGFDIKKNKIHTCPAHAQNPVSYTAFKFRRRSTPLCNCRTISSVNNVFQFSIKLARFH